MRISGLSRYVLSGCVAVAMLAGCGGSRGQTAGSDMIPTSSTTAEGQAQKRSGSSGDLLYVTTAKGVELVSYPHWQIFATIPGTANGQPCSDPRNGNVFVIQPYLAQILVYAHGGTTPINTLSAPSPYNEIYSCAVDPETGDLAATGYDSSLNKGAVLIYAGGQGTPKVYKSAKIRTFYSPAYDGTGNLYIVANANSAFRIVRLSAKKKQFSFIQFHDNVFLANFQWDGQYFASLDYDGQHKGSTLYQIEITGSSAQVINTSTLYNTAQVSNFCLAEGSLIGFFGRLKRDNNQALAVWTYPAGGKDTSRFYGAAKGPGNELYGLTLSVSPSDKSSWTPKYAVK